LGFLFFSLLAYFQAPVYVYVVGQDYMFDAFTGVMDAYAEVPSWVPLRVITKPISSEDLDTELDALVDDIVSLQKSGKRVMAVISVGTSQFTQELAVRMTIGNLQLPLVVALASSPDIKGYPYIYRIVYSDDVVLPVFRRWVAQSLPGGRYVSICEEEDDNVLWFRSVKDAFCGGEVRCGEGNHLLFIIDYRLDRVLKTVIQNKDSYRYFLLTDAAADSEFARWLPPDIKAYTYFFAIPSLSSYGYALGYDAMKLVVTAGKFGILSARLFNTFMPDISFDGITGRICFTKRGGKFERCQLDIGIYGLREGRWHTLYTQTLP
jgi:hypothetical protein